MTTEPDLDLLRAEIERLTGVVQLYAIRADSAEAKIERLRAVLREYIKHVADMEGIDFLRDGYAPELAARIEEALEGHG